MWASMGKFLMLVGGSLFVLGLLVFLLGKVPGLGKLPGDILIRGERATVFIPLGTMLLLSILLTIILNVIARIRK